MISRHQNTVLDQLCSNITQHAFKRNLYLHSQLFDTFIIYEVSNSIDSSSFTVYLPTSPFVVFSAILPKYATYWKFGNKFILNPWVCSSCMYSKQYLVNRDSQGDLDVFCVHSSFIEDEIDIFAFDN